MGVEGWERTSLSGCNNLGAGTVLRHCIPNATKPSSFPCGCDDANSVLRSSVTSASSRGSCFLSCERKSTLCGSRSPVVPLCPSSLPLPCHSNAHPCTSTCHQPGHSRPLIIFALILSSQAMPFSFILPESHSNPHPHSTVDALLHILCWCRYTLHDTQRHYLVVLGTHRGATLLRYAGEPGGGSTCG